MLKAALAAKSIGDMQQEALAACIFANISMPLSSQGILKGEVSLYY